MGKSLRKTFENFFFHKCGESRPSLTIFLSKTDQLFQHKENQKEQGENQKVDRLDPTDERTKRPSG